MSDHTLICAPEDSLLVTTKEYQTHIFFDLAYYHFCFEEYSLSSQCLQSMRELNTTQVT